MESLGLWSFHLAVMPARIFPQFAGVTPWNVWPGFCRLNVQFFFVSAVTHLFVEHWRLGFLFVFGGASSWCVFRIRRVARVQLPSLYLCYFFRTGYTRLHPLG